MGNNYRTWTVTTATITTVVLLLINPGFLGDLIWLISAFFCHRWQCPQFFILFAFVEWILGIVVIWKAYWVMYGVFDFYVKTFYPNSK